jgi:hypothetical protein
MPAANVADLRARLDAFARTRLTPADFEPTLDLDAELSFCDVTPELFRALDLLEPFGVGNPEPVFAVRGVQLTAPPRILKDKHIKLKLRQCDVGTAAPGRPGLPGGLAAASRAVSAAASAPPSSAQSTSELSAAAVLSTPRCHPDGTAIRPEDRAAAVAEAQGISPGTGNGELKTDFRSKITFDALGWHMAERLAQAPLLAGDTVDIAFSVGQNDHPEYGGLELSLRDFKSLEDRPSWPRSK